MANLAVREMVSSNSRSTNSSFSWSSRKRPRDSLEQLREREAFMSTQISSIRSLPEVPELSVQQVGRGAGLLVRGTQEEPRHSPLNLPRYVINSGAVCQRYPKGKASLLIFVFNVIASYAFGAAVTGILNIFHIEKDGEDVSQSVHLLFIFLQLLFQFCFSRMFYPIAGFIADVYIGRCKMIKVSLVLLSLGYLLLIAAFIVGGQSSLNINSGSTGRIVVDSIRVVAFIFISAGGGGFEATSIPFGADQLQGASSNEISSYFYFFYFSRNMGMILGIGIYSLVLYVSLKFNSNEFHNYLHFITTNPHINELYGVFQPLVTLFILSIGLVLMICCHHWFFKNILWENPVKLIAKILCYAATVKRHLPIRNRAFRYGEERKKRIELAKITYDGKFPDEKVEDVKTFCRILLILISLTPTMLSINAFNTILLHETQKTLTVCHPHKFLQLDLYPSIYFGVQSLLVLFILPVINFLVIPSCPKLTIRARLGIGLVLYCVGNIAVVSIHVFPLISNQHSTVSDLQLGCLLIPMIIFGVAEVLTIVSVLEFIYAQSPESMKGLLTGLFYFILGLTSILSSATVYGYYDNMQNKRLAVLHGAFTIIQALGLVFYGVVAVLHKNRVRPDGESATHQQRLMIENQLHISIITNR